MRCLVAHKWVTKPRYLNMVSESDPAYRRCKRCGKAQFGVPDGQSLRINWRNLRQGDCSDARHVRMLRRPPSRLNQLAHALGLRRTRATDRGNQEYTRR